MPETLLIGSGNRDKAAELAVLLEGLPWRVLGLKDMPPVDEPEEDGDTFEANALKKARYYGARFGTACVADDSGLAVDALGGAPGVWSARYAGEGCTYADNNAKLLRELDGTPPEQRTARFVCCAALVLPDGREHVTMGTIEGRILGACRGLGGFGYDPLFVPEDHTLTFGELDPAAKHDISHRGRAFRKMRAFLETLS
jgi:XTP/dITP diphosphohydrolase